MVCPGAEEGAGHCVRSCWWSRKVRTEDCLAVGVFRDGLGKSSRGEAEEAKDSWVQERGGRQIGEDEYEHGFEEIGYKRREIEE